MHLFTKEIDNKLFKQYPMGDDLENQIVVAKIFNPYGNGCWYLLNSDPEDPDYIWAIVDLFDVETGSVSRSELEGLKLPPFNLGLERDLYFAPISAKKLYEGLKNGQQFADGGETDTAILEDKNGDAWLFPENPDGKDFGIKLADGGETKDDYTEHFINYLTDKFKGKSHEGWQFSYDSFAGTVSWTNNNIEILATPFYEGESILPIDMVNSENGDPLYQDSLEFKPSKNLEKDEKKYFDMLSPYFMIVEGEKFKKGGKMPIIRTQFEEEEFEYADGGQTTILDEISSMSFRNQYDDREMVVIAKELEKDGGNYIKFRYIVSATSNDEAKKMATKLWEEEMGNSDLHIVEVVSNEALKYNPNYVGKYADGGQIDWEAKRKEMDERTMTIRFKIASLIGLTKALEYLEKDYVVSPYRLIEAAVSRGFITIDEIDENLWNEAVMEADDVDETYRDSGQGIGSSDMGAFVSNMLNGAGIKVGVVEGRYTRMAKGGKLETKIKNRLSQSFELPLQMAIYVPSTKDKNVVISDKELKERVSKVQKYLAEQFGGFNSVKVDGGFESSDKGVIVEDAVRVVAFANPEGFETKFENLVHKIKEWCKEWSQESIGLEFENDLFYIDSQSKYDNGGFTSSFSGTPTRRSTLTMADGGLSDDEPYDEDSVYEIHHKPEQNSKNPYLIWDKIDGVYIAEFPNRQRALHYLDNKRLGYMAKGGTTKKATFKDKVKAISKRLEGRKVKPKYVSKYGATYDKPESEEAAKNIAGSIRAKYGK